LTPLLEVRDATKRFGGVVANDRISLTVGEGSIVGLIGPNGSGKTTHPIDSGSIHFDGQEISTLRVAKIARLGLVRTYQHTRIFRQISCLDNMLISVPQRQASIWGMLGQPAAEDRARAEELLAFVGLPSKRDAPAGSLSFGQQKLLEFAMALMNEPRMLLLDEPTAGINPTLINGLVDRLKRARDALGITLFVIEHNMRVVMNLAEHIYCLAHGELLAQGPPEVVQKDPRVLAAYLGAH
jgi:branched-chain amino acid transport system ATP-binding protein